jgi:sirohydrochlorin ferrochelatase
LVVAAHGSADPRFAEVVEAVAMEVRRRRPDLDVRVGFLDHGPPHLRDIVTADCVVVPLLLVGGFHARADIPVQAPGATVTHPIGPDDRLAQVVERRLREAGWDGRAPVVLSAAGSSDDRALDDVRAVARMVADAHQIDVTAAFLSAGAPGVDDALREQPNAAVASYLVAPGAFHDVLARSGAAVVSEPLGADPLLAEIVLDRYASAQVPGRTAPA